MKVVMGHLVSPCGSRKTEQIIGFGPWWLIAWFHICGWFYGQYWKTWKRLRDRES